MRNYEDRSKIDFTEQTKFISQCTDEFVETSIVETNQKKVANLSGLSYLPNVFSFITAGFFVWYLLSGYTKTVGVILGLLLALVLISVEFGKRSIVKGIAKEYFIDGKIMIVLVLALTVLVSMSMTASYLGGKQLVVETASPPPKQSNPKIDSLNQVLAEQQATVERLQKTTWKGKVTRDATKGINEAKVLQNQIYARIATLEQQDDEAYQLTLSKHTAKHLNFGIVLGVLAALADLFLIGLLWFMLKLKYQVAVVYSGVDNEKPKPKIKQKQQAVRPSFDSILANPYTSNKIGFLANRETPKQDTLQARNETPKRNAETFHETPLRPVSNYVSAKSETFHETPKRNAETTQDDACLLAEELEKAQSNLRTYKSKLKRGVGNKKTNLAGKDRWQKRVKELEQKLQQIQ